MEALTEPLSALYVGAGMNSTASRRPGHTDKGLFGYARALGMAFVALAACAAPSTTVTPSPPPAALDLIVRGGSVLDGTGRPAYRADVGVSAGRITRIGDLSRHTAATVIDAAGLVVAPGFINIHSHASALTTAANMLTQGVTTEILNPDGFGPLDIARQVAAVESASPAVNVGAYAPFNSAWERVVGTLDRRPKAVEIAQVTALLERGLEAGAWGVSAGLDYTPAYYARTDEIVAALAPLRGWRTNFPNHERLTPGTGFSSIAGMRETIEIGERAGLVPVITHMKLHGSEQGRADETLAMMRAATARGVYTAADVYPYIAGHTNLVALLIPAWAQEGGRAGLVHRLRDPTARVRIARETEDALVARWGTPANVRVLGRNQTLADLMPVLGTTSPGEAIARILEVESPEVIATFGAEPDLVKIMQYPDAAIACDCGAARNAVHPRDFGTFPRVLGHYVREARALSLAEAVRKMTGLPASIVGMVDRGFIGVGMAADLTVFDAATVIDRATYEKPTEWSKGVRFVVVNGRIALQDGEPTGVRAGRALRRTRAMPSRPMSIASSPGLRAEAEDAGLRIKIDLAGGQLRVTGAGVALEGRAFGLLQTAPRWSSVTALVHDTATGGELGVVVIVDEVGGSVTLQVDGRPALAWRLKS
jgi:N-acyl-D-aspartate/D-glutamate deacylase